MTTAQWIASFGRVSAEDAAAHLQRRYDARGASRCGCGLARNHGPCPFAPSAATRRVEPAHGNREVESLAELAASLPEAHRTPTTAPPPCEHTPATVATPPCAADVDG